MVCRYQESSKFEKLGYEDDFLRFLQNMISDVEKRIRRGHQRLALNNAQGSVSRGVVWVCLSTCLGVMLFSVLFALHPSRSIC